MTPPEESTQKYAQPGAGPRPEGESPLDPELTRDASFSSAVQLGGVAIEVPNIPGYEIHSELGRGSMAVVYKAQHVGLNRLVALKVILAGSDAGKDELARFLVEAQTIGRLQHRNIVQIYDMGFVNGLPFLSLEFVEGGTLAQKIRAHRVSAKIAARLVEKLALAMEVVHWAGVVHRDLKPANVLMTRENVPKITDFGLAKRLNASKALTKSGLIVGTPCYMAPEQASGQKSIGPQADVWALGAILYELLTCQPPFRAGSAMQTVLQVISETPLRPSQLDPAVSPRLETICLKCLEKDKDQRYDSVRALADDLHDFRRRERVRLKAITSKKPGARRRNLPGGMAGLFGALLGEVALLMHLWAFWHRPVDPFHPPLISTPVGLVLGLVGCVALAVMPIVLVKWGSRRGSGA
jgi:serine/threonine-protein kinase